MRASAWSERGERLHVVQPFRGGWRGQLPSGRRARQELERAQEEKDARWTAQLRVHGRWGRMRRGDQTGVRRAGGGRREGGREGREARGREGVRGRCGAHRLRVRRPREESQCSRSFLGRSAPRTERRRAIKETATPRICGARRGRRWLRRTARRAARPATRRRLEVVASATRRRALRQPAATGRRMRRSESADSFVGELMKLEAVWTRRSRCACSRS